jgi:hypothetical protein
MMATAVPPCGRSRNPLALATPGAGTRCGPGRPRPGPHRVAVDSPVTDAVVAALRVARRWTRRSSRSPRSCVPARRGRVGRADRDRARAVGKRSAPPGERIATAAVRLARARPIGRADRDRSGAVGTRSAPSVEAIATATYLQQTSNNAPASIREPAHPHKLRSYIQRSCAPRDRRGRRSAQRPGGAALHATPARHPERRRARRRIDGLDGWSGTLPRERPVTRKATSGLARDCTCDAAPRPSTQGQTERHEMRRSVRCQ